MVNASLYLKTAYTIFSWFQKTFIDIFHCSSIAYAVRRWAVTTGTIRVYTKHPCYYFGMEEYCGMSRLRGFVGIGGSVGSGGFVGTGGSVGWLGLFVGGTGGSTPPSKAV